MSNTKNAPASASASEKNTTEHIHTSLYRKYRPATFADVVAQDHIVSVLKESIKNENINHAYLFCGSRGTGKTSVARIFAKALGVSANDLYEIDAASNTSVDDIRELSEAVNTMPFESRYKVYILDEVHMLSKAAFNAFLKTLEEPPKHVIFILATTEMEKLPDTVVSRCEVYNFKKPTVEILKKVVMDVAKKELVGGGAGSANGANSANSTIGASGASLEPAAAELIALLGDGSFRDTLGTLQKVLSVKGVGQDAGRSAQKITLADVEIVTGAPKASLVMGFVRGIMLKNADEALQSLGEASRENLDMKIFAKLVISRLRYLLMSSISPVETKVLAQDFSDTDIQALDEVAKKVSGQQTAEALRKMLESYHSIGKTYIQSLPLEMVVGEIVG